MQGFFGEKPFRMPEIVLQNKIALTICLPTLLELMFTISEQKAKRQGRNLKIPLDFFRSLS